ncbi:hypothetical protein G6F59_014338 [Rhizopus arrhizus]|nr:hypothetical protein G6F59_014338 [Rhizopus arrhizus]
MCCATRWPRWAPACRCRSSTCSARSWIPTSRAPPTRSPPPASARRSAGAPGGGLAGRVRRSGGSGARAGSALPRGGHRPAHLAGGTADAARCRAVAGARAPGPAEQRRDPVQGAGRQRGVRRCGAAPRTRQNNVNINVNNGAFR